MHGYSVTAENFNNKNRLLPWTISQRPTRSFVQTLTLLNTSSSFFLNWIYTIHRNDHFRWQVGGRLSSLTKRNSDSDEPVLCALAVLQFLTLVCSAGV